MDNQVTVSTNFEAALHLAQGQRYEITGYSHCAFEYIFEGTYVGNNEFADIEIIHVDADEDEMDNEEAFMTLSYNYTLITDDHMQHDVITSVKEI